MPWKKEGIATPRLGKRERGYYAMLKCPEKKKGLRPGFSTNSPDSSPVEMPWKKEGIATYPVYFLTYRNGFGWNALNKGRDCDRGELRKLIERGFQVEMPWIKEGIATSANPSLNTSPTGGVEMPWIKEGIATGTKSFHIAFRTFSWNALNKGRDCDPAWARPQLDFDPASLKCPE